MDESTLQNDLAPWLRMAHRYDGLRELDEDGELNPTVRSFFRSTHYPMELVTKRTPWCSAFACTVFELCHVPHPHSARARDWLASPLFIHLREPVLGAVLVFDRQVTGTDTLHGHIGFCDRALVSSHQTDVQCFAGNQSNAVCGRRQNLAHLIGVLWPAGYPVHPAAVLL